jgi:hypothetical protein
MADTAVLGESDAPAASSFRGCIDTDPLDEVLGAWLAKRSVRDVHLADTWRDARTLLDKTIAGRLADDVPGIVTVGWLFRTVSGS